MQADLHRNSVLNGIQTSLDVAGLVPGIGEVADGINALIYLARGDYVNAAMSTAAMVPFVGGAATAGKYISKIGRSGNHAVNRIYSARELVRRSAEPGPFHNFPESFNKIIFEKGSKTVTHNYFNVTKPGLSNTNVLYKYPGTVNGINGFFEIGVRPSISGRTEVIMHRFFNPTR